MGSGLTYTVVFGEMLRHGASSTSLALAFVCATAPGLLGSMTGERLLARRSPFFVIALAQCCGLLGLTLPALALQWKLPVLWPIAELISTLAMGLALPAIAQAGKRGLRDEELPAAAALDTFAFVGWWLI